MNDKRKRIWMTVLILVFMLPLLAYPTMLSLTPYADKSIRMLLWFYPAYVIASGVCARICCPERSEITWILLILMLFYHIGMWYLILNGL